MKKILKTGGVCVLSLFDGISCGHVALERAGIKVDKYYASEIDKYAISITQNNYPDTIQLGDVNNIDFSQFIGKIDILMGGSPCQDLSNAQANRVYTVEGKSVCLNANGGGGGVKTGLYKIDLPNGDYIIRKLTPLECERLQTLSDNYTAMGYDSDKEKEIKISNTQRYKCIGNGWTVDVIAHIFKNIE